MINDDNIFMKNSIINGLPRENLLRYATGHDMFQHN